MSLKSNIVANYASQVYATLIGIVVVPMYIKYMGSEAYGLVGFFGMLQAWFNLFDLGLTPTISRESARYRAGALRALDYRRIYRALSTLFVAIALAGGGLLFVLAEGVGRRWLKVEALAIDDVIHALQIIAVCVALRWMGGLSRSVIGGSERLVWLGGFTALVATLRFLAVFASMSIWGFTPQVFFWHQLAVALLEVTVLQWKCTSLLPDRGIAEAIGWSLKPVRPLVQFSLSIAFTSAVWALLTQSDKLVLSGILPLAEYGYFTLAVLVASSVMIIAGPISSAIMPRMARLYAEGKHDEVRRIYNQSSQIVSVTSGSLAVTLIVCADSLLYAWSGNHELTEAAAPILRLYAAGNCLLALGAFPYYLQYARGDLRYHLIGNVVLVIVLVPAIAWAAVLAGGTGAGWVWLVTGAVYFLCWVAFVHARLEPGLHADWVVRQVAVILLPTLGVGLLLGSLHSPHEGRLVDAVQAAGTGMACLVVAIFASPLSRAVVLKAFRTRSA